MAENVQAYFKQEKNAGTVIQPTVKSGLGPGWSRELTYRYRLDERDVETGTILNARKHPMIYTHE